MYQAGDMCDHKLSIVTDVNDIWPHLKFQMQHINESFIVPSDPIEGNLTFEIMVENAHRCNTEFDPRSWMINTYLLIQ